MKFDLISDLNYGQDFIMYDGIQKISDLAERYGIRLSQLLEWNSLIPGEYLDNGRVLYIQKPKKVSFHIVEPNETLEGIALKHSSTVAKIQGKNRMDKNNRVIFVGQKLYLKKKKPKGEKIIVLVNDALVDPVEEKPEPTPAEAEVDELIPGGQ